MKLHIYKYQGAGNDFVVIDNRKGDFNLNWKQIKLLCDRRFGVGSDGLMTLSKSSKANFKMDYYNCDGYLGTMCGNGGRCIVAFAHMLGFKKFVFDAYDGIHTADVLKAPQGRKSVQKIVRLGIRDVKECTKYAKDVYLTDTGTEHYIEFVKDVENYPVFENGRKIRYHKDFQPNGMNANFVQIMPKGLLKIRTYERGVEDETFACGTGSTATAIAAWCHGVKPAALKKVKTKDGRIAEKVKYNLKARGGDLAVEFTDLGGRFTDISLIGPATLVFETDIVID